ncbi:MAG: hypothetical protein F6K31_15235 [Symploca sp. SIO2G7]|nr:hypothetical protein [Symploca sp. SIO2G7]
MPETLWGIGEYGKIKRSYPLGKGLAIAIQRVCDRSIPYFLKKSGFKERRKYYHPMRNAIVYFFGFHT